MEITLMKILVVNAGSSSHKFSLYDLYNDDLVEPLWEASIDWGRKSQLPVIKIKTYQGIKIEKNLECCEIEEGIKIILDSLWKGETHVLTSLAEIEKIGHRVVHGGIDFEKPTIINATVKEKICSIIPLAPLHNRANLEAIEVMEKFFPDIVQIAIFDTAYHVTMPEIIKTYPIPLNWKEKKGIQRFGFHGISHQYCAERIGQLLEKDLTKLKIINCHLGNGCSLCAIHQGKSYETTMGLTPLEGLMMGTRCGSIDPGILLYLLRENFLTLEEIDHELNFGSGLQGISGSSDMRELLERNEEEAPHLAIEMFIHRLKTAIGAYAVSLDGFDVLSFTAGIGEHAAIIREKTCLGLKCLGIEIDLKKNRHFEPDGEITHPNSSKKIFVIQTREEWMIAKACLRY